MMDRFCIACIIFCLAAITVVCLGAPLSSDAANVSVNVSNMTFTKDWINQDDTGSFFTNFALSVLNEVLLYSPIGPWALMIVWFAFIGMIWMYSTDIGLTGITMLISATLLSFGVPREAIGIVYMMMAMAVAVVLWAAVSSGRNS